MKSTVKIMAAGLSIASLCAVTAYADGIDPMYNANGDYIDDLEIIGDVVMDNGDKMVAFQMRNEHLRFLVPPEAAYVIMDANTPVIAQKTPFSGIWISTQSVDVANWPACGFAVLADNNESYQVHGTLTWTNIGLSDDLDLAFTIQLGACGAPQQPWAFSNATFN